MPFERGALSVPAFQDLLLAGEARNAHGSAQAKAMRFMELPFCDARSIVRRAAPPQRRPEPLSSAGRIRHASGRCACCCEDAMT